MEDPIKNYPQLTRYMVPDMDLESVIHLCPVPFLSDPGEKLDHSAPDWWRDDMGKQIDGPLELQELMPNLHDPLWDMRVEGVKIIQLRHLVYRTQLPLYMLAWWHGWSVQQLGAAYVDWIKPAPVDLGEIIG